MVAKLGELSLNSNQNIKLLGRFYSQCGTKSTWYLLFQKPQAFRKYFLNHSKLVLVHIFVFFMGTVSCVVGGGELDLKGELEGPITSC